MKKTFITKNVEETQKIAADFAAEILGAKKTNPPQPSLIREGAGKNSAIIIGLVGDLGGGKTSFVQGFAKALGIKQKITSPTFVVMKRYKIPNYKIQMPNKSEIRSTKSETNSKNKNSNFKNLIHIDAYRLKSGEDLKAIGWDEIIKNPSNIILIEWPENVKEAMPKKYVKIGFEYGGGDRRRIIFKI